MKFIIFYTETEKDNASFKEGSNQILPVQIKDGSWILPLETKEFLLKKGIKEVDIKYEDLNESDLYEVTESDKEVIKIPIEGIKDVNGDIIEKGAEITFTGMVDQEGNINLKDIQIV